MRRGSFRLGPLQLGPALFLLFTATPFVAATNVGRTDTTVQDTPSVGDLGYVIELAVKTAVTQASQDQGETNRVLQDEIRGLKADVRDRDAAHAATVQGLNEKLNAQDTALRDLRAEVRDKDAAHAATILGPVSYTHLTLPTICSV